MLIVVVLLLGFKSSSKTKDYEISNPPIELGLDAFYKKYVNVNGIHIISSHKVPDEAVFAVCKTVDFMTKSLPKEVLQQMVKVDTKVGIMARYEGTTDIPEHAHLSKDTTLNWDVRARGLGGTLRNPITTCAEENVLCYQIDKYHAEDMRKYDPALYTIIGNYFADFDESPSCHEMENLFQE